MNILFLKLSKKTKAKAVLFFIIPYLIFRFLSKPSLILTSILLNNLKFCERRTFIWIKEPICSLVGMNAYAGCRSYDHLPENAQRIIRMWSMSNKDTLRKFLKPRFRQYFHKLRHSQLLHGNSRFCCKTIQSKSARIHSYQSFILFILYFNTLL